MPMNPARVLASTPKLHEVNGQAPAARFKPPIPRRNEPVEFATMADASKVIGSIRYLVREWIPYGMVVGIVAEPGMGKSSFLLGLAKTVVNGGKWFNGDKGPSKRGRVLWCDTENCMAITLQRM